MLKKWIKILKIVSILLIIAVEVLVWRRLWFGNDIAKLLSSSKAYIILTFIIIVISIIDKAILLIIDLFKGIKNKKHRELRIIQLEEEIQNSDYKIKKIPILFHLIIFENLWLLILVFTLHATEWIVNGVSLYYGKTDIVEFYSIGMRVIEYPIVTVTLIWSYIKDNKRFNKLLKKED